jgi:hypothetical protein
LVIHRLQQTTKLIANPQQVFPLPEVALKAKALGNLKRAALERFKAMPSQRRTSRFVVDRNDCPAILEQMSESPGRDAL